MRPTGTFGPRRIRPVALTALAVSIATPMGCGVPASDRLVIATNWPLADRRRLESEFADWVAASPLPAVDRPVRLDWLILEPGGDRARVAGRRRPPDVLLGGPALSFERLDRAGRLAPLPLDGSPSWLIRRPSPRDSAPPSATRALLNDPRNDLSGLAEAKSLLGGHFQQGYALLVREAGHTRRIGRLAGRTTPPSAEGVAIPQGCRHPELARTFLRFLVATGRAESAPSRPASSSPPEADDLLADLLGATLVDAQDELWAAWRALERANHPQAALRWMTEPPPWPPASVARLLSRPGDHGLSMVETLVGQLATEPSVRAWLIRSWLSPPRLIDEALLDELARAADGQLAREPRFRQWLRAEWTAWARQRYRRVARLAAASSTDASRHHGESSSNSPLATGFADR